MNPATLPSLSDHSPADRLAFILESLHRALGRHADAQRLTGRASIIGPFLILIWKRVRRIGLRFAARAAREAATLCANPSRQQATPEAVTASREAASPSRGRPKPRSPDPLPRRKAWLLTLIPETAPITAQLSCFMADPEVAALLAAAPRLRSILNPLCHMLGIRRAQALLLWPSPSQPSLQPPGAPPAALLIPYDAAPQPTAPRPAEALAFSPWTTPPPSPDASALLTLA